MTITMQNDDQNLILNDSKYRNYVNLMERALKGFESTHEWADLISALAKVNKVGSFLNSNIFSIPQSQCECNNL